MQEGFDVGLEMSGHASALRDMIANMSHGAQDRHARHSHPARSPSTGRTVVFNMLTIKGIYGREMYETWYKMTVMLRMRPGYPARDHAPVPLSRIRAGLRGDAHGQIRQSDFELGSLSATPSGHGSATSQRRL